MSHQSLNTQLRHRRQMQPIQRTAVDGRYRMLGDRHREKPTHQISTHERSVGNGFINPITSVDVAFIAAKATQKTPSQLNRDFKFSERRNYYQRFSLYRCFNCTRVLIGDDQFQKAACIDVEQNFSQSLELLPFNFASSSADSCSSRSSRSFQAAQASSEISIRSSRDSINGVSVSKISSPHISSRHFRFSSGSNLFFGNSSCTSTGNKRATGLPSNVTNIPPSAASERSASGQHSQTFSNAIDFMHLA